MRRATHTGMIPVLLIAVGAALGIQSRAPVGARLKVRWQGSTVRFQDGGSSHEVSIKGQFNAAVVESVKLQSAKEANGAFYLLLDVSGPSKYPADARHCGAGTESNLIWLKLDRDWKFLDAKNFLYESCWDTVESADPPRWDGDTLRVSAEKFTATSSETQVVTYSYKHPEEGLKVSEAAIVKQ